MLLSDGMAAKSKLSSDLTAREPSLSDAALEGSSLPLDLSQLSQPQQITGMVDAFGGGLRQHQIAQFTLNA